MRFAKSGLLRHHWLAGGEITGAPLAEPTTTQAHVHILGDRELAHASPRYSHDNSRGSRRRGIGIFHTPPVAFEHLHGSRIIDGQGQGKFLIVRRGQLEDFQKLAMLAPGVTFTVIFQVFDRLIPMANRREVSGRRITGRLPTIEDDRGAGRLVRKGLQLAHRNPAGHSWLPT